MQKLHQSSVNMKYPQNSPYNSTNQQKENNFKVNQKRNEAMQASDKA